MKNLNEEDLDRHTLLYQRRELVEGVFEIDPLKVQIEKQNISSVLKLNAIELSLMVIGNCIQYRNV